MKETGAAHVQFGTLFVEQLPNCVDAGVSRGPQAPRLHRRVVAADEYRNGSADGDAGRLALRLKHLNPTTALAWTVFVQDPVTEGLACVWHPLRCQVFLIQVEEAVDVSGRPQRQVAIARAKLVKR